MNRCDECVNNILLINILIVLALHAVQGAHAREVGACQAVLRVSGSRSRVLVSFSLSLSLPLSLSLSLSLSLLLFLFLFLFLSLSLSLSCGQHRERCQTTWGSGSRFFYAACSD